MGVMKISIGLLYRLLKGFEFYIFWGWIVMCYIFFFVIVLCFSIGSWFFVIIVNIRIKMCIELSIIIIM